MSRFAILCLFVAGCAGAPSTSTTDQPIIGGQTASTSNFRTVVDLESGPGEWFCTGTLIDKDWILTAAHCVTDETASTIQIRFDADAINDGDTGKVVAVAEVHGDPQFDDVAWDNDIAVIKLAHSITDRAPTPVHRDPIAIGAQVTEVGYGNADNNDGGGGILRKLDTTSIDCAKANDPELANANLICFDARDGTTSCNGDSGGPAFVATNAGLEVAGITSGGSEDLCTGGWDLYTKVAAEIAFVDQFVPRPTAGGGGSGGGSDLGGGVLGSGDGSGSGSGGDGSEPQTGGCTAGGDAGALVAAAAIALARWRRARRRRASC